MRNIRLVAKKEINHGLNSQVAYLLILVFVISLPIPIFWSDSHTNIFLNGQTDLRIFFSLLPLYLMIFVPALAMRAWSEERHSGTLEILMTFPIRERDLVLGKFAGNFALLLCCLLCTAVLPLLTASIGDLDWGPVIGGYAGAVLLAGGCLAICLLVGFAAPNQVSAFILSFLALALLMLIDVPAINLQVRFLNIARGVLDSRDLFFYAGTTFVVLYINILLIKARR